MTTKVELFLAFAFFGALITNTILQFQISRVMKLNGELLLANQILVNVIRQSFTPHPRPGKENPSVQVFWPTDPLDPRGFS